ncbi:hypothetical protein Q8F55_005147 [Vanrija albida]|uniref:Uncharacterized protein n=1 Tax=Vanrija albida TaxID=181172 RepID=A0ABR3Q0T5_9TREE
MDSSHSFSSGQRPHFWPLLGDDQLAGVQALLTSPAAVAAFLPGHLHRHLIAEHNLSRLGERAQAESRYDAADMTALDLLDAWGYVQQSFGVAVGIPVETKADEHEHKHSLFGRHKHKDPKPAPGAIVLDGRETAPMTDLVALAGFTDAGNGRHRAALAALEPLLKDYPANTILGETFELWERVLRDGVVLAYAFRALGGGAPATLPVEWTTAPASAAGRPPAPVGTGHSLGGREHVHAALAEAHDGAGTPAFPRHRDPDYFDPAGRVAFPTPHPAGGHPCPSGEHPLPPLPPGAR